MAKLLCMFALAGLAAGAPQTGFRKTTTTRVTTSGADQDAILSSILSSLQPQIDQAIESTLGETKSTYTVQKTVQPLQVVGYVTKNTEYSSTGGASGPANSGASKSVKTTTTYKTSSQGQSQNAGQQILVPGVIQQAFVPQPVALLGTAQGFRYGQGLAGATGGQAANTGRVQTTVKEVSSNQGYNYGQGFTGAISGQPANTRRVQTTTVKEVSSNQGFGYGQGFNGATAQLPVNTRKVQTTVKEVSSNQGYRYGQGFGGAAGGLSANTGNVQTAAKEVSSGQGFSYGFTSGGNSGNTGRVETVSKEGQGFSYGLTTGVNSGKAERVQTVANEASAGQGFAVRPRPTTRRVVVKKVSADAIRQKSGHLGVIPKKAFQQKNEVTTTTVTTTGVSNDEEKQLAQNVMTALVPSIEAAVKAAFLRLNNQESAVQTSTSTQQSTQEAAVQTSTLSQQNTQGSGFNTQVTEVTTSNAVDSAQLLQTVMAALVPQIEQLVNSAYQQSLKSSATFSTGDNKQTTTATFTTNAQQAPAVVSNQVKETQQTVSTITGSSNSQTFNTDDNEAIVFKIVQSIAPSISATVNEVVNAGQTSAEVSNAQTTSTGSNQQSTFQTTTTTTSEQANFENTGSSAVSNEGSSINYDSLISKIIATLTPTVQATVQNALGTVSISSGSQENSAVNQETSTGNQQSSTFNQQSSTFTTQTSTNEGANLGVSQISTQQDNSIDTQSLILRIIEILTPTITTTVNKALAVQQSAVSVQAPVTVTNTQTTTTVQSSNNEQASVGGATSSGFSAQRNEASSLNYDALVAQIISSLQPSISLTVQDALNRQGSTSQTFSTQTSETSNVGFSNFSENSSANAQTSNVENIQTSSVESSQSSSVDRSSSGYASSGALQSIFGDGSFLNVKVETPNYNVAYST